MKYSILVNSCDSYSDAWPMFFFLLKKMWLSDIPPIYLNTESKSYSGKEVPVLVLNSNEKEEPWGKRLVNALTRINSEYVLMVMEDFYFESPIKTSIVDKCVDMLDADNSIICYQFTPNGEYDTEESSLFYSNIGGFKKRKQFGLYTVAAGPTMWRKSDLIKLTRANDNPWEWEFFGSHRTWLYRKKIYCWTSKEEKIFDYDIDHGGAIHRGKWVGYKMMELCERFDYRLDYGNREVVNDWMQEEQNQKTVPWYLRIKSVIRNKANALWNIMYGALLNIC